MIKNKKGKEVLFGCYWWVYDHYVFFESEEMLNEWRIKKDLHRADSFGHVNDLLIVEVEKRIKVEPISLKRIKVKK